MNQNFNFILLGYIGPQEILIILIVVILPLAGIWRLFEKANKPGWAAIIPIYNGIVFMQVIGKPWWWILLWCLPYINFIWIIWSLNLLVKSFGKNEGYTVGVVLFGIVFIPMLGFGSSEYVGPAGKNYLLDSKN